MHTLSKDPVALEKMNDFFSARVEAYDEHMRSNVKGCEEAYKELAALIPSPCEQLLDLGCGTGLELEKIFELFPNVHVTGIDLTQAMHHFSHEAKIGLYQKIYNSLNCDGRYIECDYMVETQEEEDFYFAEYDRLRDEMGISKEAFYHYDTPCTIDNQIEMLKCAGFKEVEKVFRMGNTTIITAKK